MNSNLAPVIAFRSPHKVIRHYRGTDRPSLSPDALVSVLIAARAISLRHLTLFVVAVSHGFRVSELADMRTTDLDMANGKVLVRRLKGSADGWQRMQNVYGFDEAAILGEWLTQRPTGSDVLFPSRQSDANGDCILTRSQISRMFGAVCQAAGISREYAHCHTLRHTCGQRIYDAGAPLEHVAQYLGHKNINSTRCYAAPSADQVNQSVVRAFQVAV